MPPTQTHHKHKPNRIFEVFIVVGILGLVVVMLVSFLNQARNSTKNITVVSQVREYQQALDAYFLEYGSYPNKNGERSGIVCLGNYDTDSCWENGTSVVEDEDLFSPFVPNFISEMPHGPTDKMGKVEDSYYTGMVYQYSVSGRAYIIQYFLSGPDQSCVLDKARGETVGKDTHCVIAVSI